jgi:hypothetical protein
MGWLILAVTAVKGALLWTGDYMLGHNTNTSDHKDHVINTYVDYYQLPEHTEDKMRNVANQIDRIKDIKGIIRDIQV